MIKMQFGSVTLYYNNNKGFIIGSESTIKDSIIRTIFLGESNISWYVYKIDTCEYFELDNPSGSVLEKYNSFEEMFAHMLEESLV